MATAPYISAALTADGGSNGIIQVVSTASFVKGAKVYLGASGLPTVELEIADIPNSTQMAVKLKSSPSARYNSSGYTTAASAVVVQPEQDVFLEPPKNRLDASEFNVDLVRARPGSTLQLLGDQSDSPTAVGVRVGSNVTYVTFNAKPVAFVNGSTELAYLDRNGALFINNGLTCSSVSTGGIFGGNSVSPILYVGGMLNSGTANGNSFQTANFYTTSGAKLANFVNGGTEKLAVDKDGNLKFQNTGILRYSTGSSAFEFDGNLSNTNGSDGTITTDVVEAFGSSGYAGRYYAPLYLESDLEINGGSIKYSDFADGTATPGNITQNVSAGKCKIAAGESSVTITNNKVGANAIIYAILQSADATLTQILRVEVSAGSFNVVGNANATDHTEVRWSILHAG